MVKALFARETLPRMPEGGGAADSDHNVKGESVQPRTPSLSVAARARLTGKDTTECVRCK